MPDAIHEMLAKDVAFAADGTGTEEQTVRVRMMADAAVAAFGILRFPYRAENQRLDVMQVSVTATDGTVVTTPSATNGSSFILSWRFDDEVP